MMRSLFSAVSGLKNHQTRMDVIGNNIANVNTTGFKASRVNFEDIFSQTLQGATAPNGNTSGSNPMQVGLGMGVASIETLFTDGNVQSTGKQTDLAIQGNGFFIVSNNGGLTQYYTRAGNFDFDAAGNYNLPGTGLQVMGYGVDATGNIDTSKLIPLKIDDTMKTMAPKATSNVTFTNNLSADATVAVGTVVSGGQPTVYGTNSTEHTLSCSFTKTAAGWDLTAKDETGATVGTTVNLTFDVNGKLTSPAANPSWTYTPTTGGSGPLTLSLSLSGLTQYGGSSTVKTTADGYPQGSLTKKTISTSGVITGTYDNGQSQTIGQVALADFANPAGLDKEGDTLFVKSTNSGSVAIGIPGTGGLGQTNSGSLEMSNVNLADEMTNMIVTQRGFQSNSKIITTDDEMLDTLANLKR